MGGGQDYITVHWLNNEIEDVQIPHSVIDGLLEDYYIDYIGDIQAARWVEVFREVDVQAINREIVAGGGAFVYDEPNDDQAQQYFWKTPAGTYAYISTFNDFTEWRVWNVTDIYIID